MRRFLVFAVLLAVASALHAEPRIVSKSFEAGLTKSRWTPEALASARPMPLPRAAFDPELIRTEVAKVDEEPFDEVFPSFAEEPVLTKAERDAFRERLYDFTPDQLRALQGLLETAKPAKDGAKTGAKNFGEAGLDYTSSRLIPSEAVETFPYSAVGKLFFSDSEGGNFVCSGAVIGKRLVITAGHCVHDGPAVGFFDNFLFVPAFLNGNAPFGSWEATTAFVTEAWSLDGQAPHPHDFALLEIADQGGQTIADVTGKLAFLADSLSDNHLHLLGYPTNLDQGQELHQVTSGDFIDFIENTTVYGSDMGGGSSGGPWVQNFNRKSQGQGGGRNRARAAVVGVTSYGFNDTSLRVQGASDLTRDFKVLRQQACFNQSGNC